MIVMIAVERYEKIVELVNVRGTISTKELALTFGVTEKTIRLDCEDLEKQGLLVRVHGGVKSLKNNHVLSNKDEKNMSERANVYNQEKDIVCKYAACLIKDGDCIFLDGGSTIVPLLKYIKGKRVKIVTHSSLIITSFNDTEAELFSIGGKYIPEYNMSVGPITLSDLERFNFDFAFLSCAGLDIDQKLVYTAEMETKAVKQKAMHRANKKYLLIDSSKLFIKGFCSFIKSDDFDGILCNQDTMIPVDSIPNNFIVVEE